MVTVPILFENEDLLVVEKPSGIVVHPFDYGEEETLIDIVKRTHPEVFSFKNEIILQDKRVINLGGLVHKLDRDTSGVMVLAKNEATFSELRRQFTSHMVSKSYTALVEGVIEKDTCSIDAPLGRSKKDYKQSTNPESLRGEMKEAITELRVLERKEKTTLVDLSPKTGRTHQLRAHVASIGHPIVGDKAYGSTIENERILLHAQKLSFSFKDVSYSFESKVPKQFYM